MDLIQRGFSCEYDMEIFIKIFFANNEKGIVLTDLSYKDGKIETYVEIIFGGKTYTQNKIFPFCFEENEKTRKKLFTCSVTKTFVAAAQKIRNIKLPWGVMSGIRPAKVVRQYRDMGYSKEETRKILKDVYDVSDEKISLAMTVAENEKRILKEVGKNSVSMYIGIPFCPTRCIYCSFVSTDIRKSGKYMDTFCDLLVEEIKKMSQVLEKCSFYVENIYIGGGTPTTLSEENLGKIFNALSKYIITDKLKEYTLEAGRPDTITFGKLSLAKKSGVNRISINPQTMNKKTLKKIGRNHSPEMIRDAFSLARECGFDCINMDLIAGLPDEEFEDFKFSLDEVIKINPENITVHSMCLKKAAALRFSNIEMTNAEKMNKMLAYTAECMEKIKKEPYYMYRQKNISGNLENVGYAERERMSFYNINIMEEAQTIVALGGGAVTKLVLGDRIERIFNFKDPYEYIKRFNEIISKKDEILKFYGAE